MENGWKFDGRQFRITLDRKSHDQDPEEQRTFWGNTMSYSLKKIGRRYNHL